MGKTGPQFFYGTEFGQLATTNRCPTIPLFNGSSLSLIYLFHCPNNSIIIWKRLQAFTSLQRFPNCTVLLPKSPFFVMNWKTDTSSLCDVMWRHTIIPWPHLTSYCHVTWSHTIGHNDFTWEFPLKVKARKSHFLALWPWPLTYDLDLQSQPS